MYQQRLVSLVVGWLQHSNRSLDLRFANASPCASTARSCAQSRGHAHVHPGPFRLHNECHSHHCSYAKCHNHRSHLGLLGCSSMECYWSEHGHHLRMPAILETPDQTDVPQVFLVFRQQDQSQPTNIQTQRSIKPRPSFSQYRRMAKPGIFQSWCWKFGKWKSRCDCTWPHHDENRYFAQDGGFTRLSLKCAFVKSELMDGMKSTTAVRLKPCHLAIIFFVIIFLSLYSCHFILGALRSQGESPEFGYLFSWTYRLKNFQVLKDLFLMVYNLCIL